MGYSILDIIDRSTDICEKILKIYKDINDNQKSMNSLKIVSNVFMTQEKEKINYYNELKIRLDNENIKEIDFFVYDKISSLMAQFNGKLTCCNYDSVQEFITCVLNMNKNIRALFIDIRGRMIQKQGDGESCEYKILTDMIKMEEEYIMELEELCNN